MGETALDERLPTITSAAAMVVVESQEQAEEAGALARDIRDMMAQVSATFDPIIKRAHAAHKEAIAQKKRFTGPLEVSERRVRDAISIYLARVAAERRKAEEQAMIEAQRQRDKEIASTERRLTALLKKSEKLTDQIAAVQMEIERPDLSDVEREVMTARLETLMAQSQQVFQEAADKQAEMAVAAATPAVTAMPASREPIAGVSGRIVNTPEIFNPMSIIKAVAAGSVPVSVVAFDMANIRRLVNAGMVIPGVRVTARHAVVLKR